MAPESRATGVVFVPLNRFGARMKKGHKLVALFCAKHSPDHIMRLGALW